MFEVLVREAAARFGLGDKSLQVVQMLLAYMTSKDRGGLFGFLEKFKAAGLGPIIQSWLGGGPSAQPISNSQLESVLGSSGGLLSLITERLDLDRDHVTSALGYLLPTIVGRLTPGGTIVASLPPEIATLAQAGEQLLATPVTSVQARTVASAGLVKWAPWIIVALAVVFGLSYLGQRTKGSGEPAPAAAPPAAPSSTSPAAATGGETAAPPAPGTASQGESPAATESGDAAPTQEKEAEPAPAPQAGAATPAQEAEPAGAAVVASRVDDEPALAVYFDSGKADVDASFAESARELVDYLKSHPDAQAVIAGPGAETGGSAADAELSRSRAKAVQAALVALGVEEPRTVIEEPAEAAAASASDAASRRVEVTLRH